MKPVQYKSCAWKPHHYQKNTHKTTISTQKTGKKRLLWDFGFLFLFSYSGCRFPDPIFIFLKQFHETVSIFQKPEAESFSSFRLPFPLPFQRGAGGIAILGRIENSSKWVLAVCTIVQISIPPKRLLSSERMGLVETSVQQMSWVYMIFVLYMFRLCSVSFPWKVRRK